MNEIGVVLISLKRMNEDERLGRCGVKTKVNAVWVCAAQSQIEDLLHYGLPTVTFGRTKWR